MQLMHNLTQVTAYRQHSKQQLLKRTGAHSSSCTIICVCINAQMYSMTMVKQRHDLYSQLLTYLNIICHLFYLA